MRKALTAVSVLAVLVALVVAATAAGAPRSATAIPGCATGSLNLLTAGTLTIGTDNPAYPPWFGGNEKKPWKVSDPNSGKGYESAVAYAVAKQLGFAKTAQHNWLLLRGLDHLAGLGRPLLVGASRKRFLGELLAGPAGPRPVRERDDAGAAISALLAATGIWGVRTHTVRAHLDAIAVAARMSPRALATDR